MCCLLGFLACPALFFYLKPLCGPSAFLPGPATPRWVHWADARFCPLPELSGQMPSWKILLGKLGLPTPKSPVGNTHSSVLARAAPAHPTGRMLISSPALCRRLDVAMGWSTAEPHDTLEAFQACRVCMTRSRPQFRCSSAPLPAIAPPTHPTGRMLTSMPVSSCGS